MATADTPPLWPAIFDTGCPEIVSHIAIAPFLPPITTRWPVASKAAAVTSASAPKLARTLPDAASYTLNPESPPRPDRERTRAPRPSAARIEPRSLVAVNGLNSPADHHSTASAAVRNKRVPSWLKPNAGLVPPPLAWAGNVAMLVSVFHKR